MTDQEILLKVDHLVKYFPIMKGGLFPKQIGSVRAVDGVSFDIHRGERWPGGRIWLRQIHHGPQCPAIADSDLRACLF